MPAKKTRSKQSKVSVTGLKRSLFIGASIRLTLFHFAIAFGIVLIFSLIVYYQYRSIILGSPALHNLPDEQQSVVVNELMHRFRDMLVTIDLALGLLVLSVDLFVVNRIMMPIRSALNTEKHFVADVSHQLRTPITVLKADMDVTMMEYARNHPAYRLAASSLEEVDKMQRIVERLLLHSRIESGREVLQLEDSDLTKIVCSGVSHFKKFAKQNQVELTFKCPQQALMIKADKLRLDEAISNIIENAIVYTNKKGRVNVTLEKRANNVMIKVEDSGIGIAKKDLDKIFVRHYRVDDKINKTGRGNGLGLSIADWVITKHGGSITMQSCPNVGTTVLIYLPLS